ncbi:hypothetical protein BCR36DRAFT_374936 [Piromyces finnis]|uniref:Periplasmic binding protein-like II n=1 Tax=Piromyces finnis TaxID=1754191 RepID=A0A1Y1UV68_9FUNG|nr:hypothetical protein BCR36DRAFT_374936 [Piromyces finnis]|eukprot:ORX41870.1 hypothetical protein BCR36DRAFT_374936 [Piromyces finnis]
MKVLLSLKKVKTFSKLNDSTLYYIDTYDKNNHYQKRYTLNFNYTSKIFDEYEFLTNLDNIKTAIICEGDDIDRTDNNKKIITLWNTSFAEKFDNSALYASVFPIWLKKHKNQEKTFCLKIEAAGWVDNVNAEICNDNDKSVPCPDLIILGTTQPYSDYWGENYMETWNWEKVFKYAEIITECTGKPGFKFSGNITDDSKFFVILCQALGIPFIIEDTKLDIKKSGFREKKYIDKLSIIKDLFEKHYIEEWLDESEIKKWQNSSYPQSIIDQPSFSHKKKNRNFNLNGIMIDFLDKNDYPNVKYSYMPGNSSFLGGSGIVITKKSKYQEEAYDFIEILLNDNFPYFSKLNILTSLSKDISNNKNNTKKELCNKLLELDGTFPYYYAYKNNIHVIYLKHISTKSGKGIILDNSFNNSFNNSIFNDLFNNKEFICDDDANYEKKTITYYDEFRIKLSLNNSETIVLKSMRDIKFIEKMDDLTLSVLNNILAISKPLQVSIIIYI